ncbi:hypothetical protein BPOR_0134g00090 [Botrytis porri]|uniref:Uncharacterized protein n=1 Tax=Botrytis porri TaxID=87229 RepID=A0A4Z1KWL0_9HELO|nr:hypothetical protein BPOR_0134g00090 [Botrytis porri]
MTTVNKVLKIPGLGDISLSSELPTSSRFHQGSDDWKEVLVQKPRLTARELAMMGLTNLLTDMPNWHIIQPQRYCNMARNGYENLLKGEYGRVPIRSRTHGTVDQEEEPGTAFTYEDWKKGRNGKSIVGQAVWEGLPEHAWRSERVHECIDTDHEFYSISLQESFREKGLQVFVQIGSIELHEWDNPWLESDWDIDGTRSEHIAATSICFYDVQNIANMQVSFRQKTCMSKPAYHRSDDDLFAKTFGIEEDEKESLGRKLPAELLNMIDKAMNEWPIGRDEAKEDLDNLLEEHRWAKGAQVRLTKAWCGCVVVLAICWGIAEIIERDVWAFSSPLQMFFPDSSLHLPYIVLTWKPF